MTDKDLLVFDLLETNITVVYKYQSNSTSEATQSCKLSQVPAMSLNKTSVEYLIEQYSNTIELKESCQDNDIPSWVHIYVDKGPDYARRDSLIVAFITR